MCIIFILYITYTIGSLVGIEVRVGWHSRRNMSLLFMLLLSYFLFLMSVDVISHFSLVIYLELHHEVNAIARQRGSGILCMILIMSQPMLNFDRFIINSIKRVCLSLKTHIYIHFCSVTQTPFHDSTPQLHFITPLLSMISLRRYTTPWFPSTTPLHCATLPLYPRF